VAFFLLGNIMPKQYVFFARSYDGLRFYLDGLRFYLDGKCLIDNYHSHTGTGAAGIFPKILFWVHPICGNGSNIARLLRCNKKNFRQGAPERFFLLSPLPGVSF